MKESSIQKKIMLALSNVGARLFRNNVGKCWIGRSKVITEKTTMTLNPGDVVITSARRFNAGLHKGSSDLIGWTPIEVTQAMVGGKVAVFTAPEIKSNKGRLSEDQKKFLKKLNDDGGIGFVARSEEEALQKLEDLMPS